VEAPNLRDVLERAAESPGGSPLASPEVEFFRVDVRGSAFAVDAALIQEVVRTPPLTPLPGAPAFLVGVAAHRGDVLAVVDLARLLGRGETQVHARSRMAVARVDGMAVGLIADAVLGLAAFPARLVQPAPVGAEGSEFISGVVVEAGRTLHVLDLRRALASARERAISRR
jgi:chemotaxis signal transduction protein